MVDMVSGKYRIYEDGVLIAETPNVVTHYGRREILRILAGTGTGFQNIVYGIGTTAESLDDESLSFHVGSANIIFGTPIYNITTPAESKIIFKARVDGADSVEIHELGISNGTAEAPLLHGFTTGGVYEYTNGTPTITPGGRYGGVTIGIATGETLTTLIGSPPQGINPNDELQIAGSGGDVLLTLTDNADRTASGSFNLPVSYGIVGATVASLTQDAGFDIGNVVKMSLAATGACEVDAVSYKSPSLTGGLASRAVLGSPVTKSGSARLDLEYEMTFGFGVTPA